MSLVAYASSGDESDEEIAPPLPKKREPVKITVPSLKEFKDDEEEKEVKILKPKTGSGLFSLLPPPKNSAVLSKPGFTPYVFSKKKETKPKPEPIKEKPKAVADVNITENDSKDSPEKVNFFSLGESSVSSTSNLNDESKAEESKYSSEKVDFFSLETKPVHGNEVTTSNQNHLTLSHTISSAPEQFSQEVLSSAAVEDVIPSTWDSKYASNVNALPTPESSSSDWHNEYINNDALPMSESSSSDWNNEYIGNEAESNSEVDVLQDEGFLKLKGKRAREEIQFIDVKADDQLVGKDKWIMQNLTEETAHRPSKARHLMPTQQQRRKHQITYLAFQAKERELDLKNQWANNSRTRRETQAKYGF